MNKISIIPPKITYRQGVNNIENITSWWETLTSILYKLLTEEGKWEIIEHEKSNLPSNENIANGKIIKSAQKK